VQAKARDQKASVYSGFEQSKGQNVQNFIYRSEN